MSLVGITYNRSIAHLVKILSPDESYSPMLAWEMFRDRKPELLVYNEVKLFADLVS